MMTNGEHDGLWREGAKSLPEIELNLKIVNYISILDRLKEAGVITEDHYKRSLMDVSKVLRIAIEPDA